MRSLGALAATTIVALVALSAAAIGRAGTSTRAAREPGRMRTMRLQPASGLRRAAGVARVRETRLGQRITLHLRGLAPSRAYDVRDADDGRVLGTATTTAEGRARVSLGESAGTGAERWTALATVDRLRVIDAATGDVVLRRDWRRTFETVAVGVASYDSPSGELSRFQLVSFPDRAEESVVFDLFVPLPGGWSEGSQAHRLNLEGPDLPLGATRASDLSGTRFDVRDLRGTVVASGRVPEMEPPRRTVTITFPRPKDDGGIVPGEPSYFLRFLDESGAETEIHALRPDLVVRPGRRR